MMIKEQIQRIIKEHKILKEQLIDEVNTKLEGIEDDKFSKITESILGKSMSKDEFKEQVANGELSLENIQKIEEACSGDDNMKMKKESDGVTGEHKIDEPAPAAPAAPAPAQAADNVAGEHKTENADEDADDMKKEGADEDKDDISTMKEEYEEMKEAIEGDLLNLLKDLIAKVHELEQKLEAMNTTAPEAEAEPAPAATEPQPPVTQEGFHGAKPIIGKTVEKSSIARSVGKSFFESRSKR